MNHIGELVAGGEELAHCALMQGIPLPGDIVRTLAGARGKLLAGPAPSDTDRDEFLAALANASQAVKTPITEIRSARARLKRLRPQVDQAMRLLSFAAANGKKVDEEVRTSLTRVANALSAGTASPAQEDEFLKSYESLCLQTAPVTAESLEASDTKLPDLSSLPILRNLGHFTLGRYVNVLIFIGVLLLAGVTLAYYAQGATALARYDELKQKREKIETESTAKFALVKSLQAELERLEQQAVNSDPAALEATRKSLAEARLQASASDFTYTQLRKELDNIPSRLAQWAIQPCDSNLLVRSALCSSADRPTASDTRLEATLAQVEAAKAVAARLSGIYLPMLLGWLGAQAFILRKMTREIQDHTFAKDSSLHHIARSGLGALAGLASTWLLTPDVIGGAQWKSLPTWALAFVAGYGIELVFEFMDRIIAAFTKRT